ncbi:MAG TPA: competence type IV pilus minor pilin ComGG [Pseudogracilibacillus sp.]|nr:competence type IV pilus minor pilin ComGG [Pseudogracilibacillus sp.]
MKGFYSFLRNERAFFLPFVLFIFFIIFSVVTTSITIYQNELKISNHLYEQLKTETLVEMTKLNFIQALETEELRERGELTYTFPQGDVSLQYEKKKAHTYKIYLDIITDQNTEFFIELVVNNEK